jgi:hypothetical protein
MRVARSPSFCSAEGPGQGDFTQGNHRGDSSELLTQLTGGECPQHSGDEADKVADEAVKAPRGRMAAACKSAQPGTRATTTAPQLARAVCGRSFLFPPTALST